VIGDSVKLEACQDAQTYPRIMLHAVLHNRTDLQFTLVQHGVSWRGLLHSNTSLDERSCVVRSGACRGRDGSKVKAVA